MHCINISHPDFKALQEDLNINPEILKAKVSVWMDNNTAERFPTSEELRTPSSIKQTVSELFKNNPELANQVYEVLGFQGSISLESNLKNPGKTEQELIDYLKQKYPEIKLDISNNPVWEYNDEVFNQFNLKKVKNAAIITTLSYALWNANAKIINTNIQYKKDVTTSLILKQLSSDEYLHIDVNGNITEAENIINRDAYNYLTKIWSKSGYPKITITTDSGKSRYNPLNNTITINVNRIDPSDGYVETEVDKNGKITGYVITPDLFIAEITHAIQASEGKMYFGKAILDFIKGVGNWNNTYAIEGALEYEAHSELEPKIVKEFESFFKNQTINNQIIGQANIKAMTVLVDAINKKADTIPHEYAHHYIAWFRDTPIVQEGIKRFGSEEALVQAIGEQVIKQKGEAYNWWKKFTNWLLNLLSDKQLLQILTDSFLNRKNLNDFTYNQPILQQKQQAQQLYSQYIEQTGKQDIEGFKNWKKNKSTIFYNKQKLNSFQQQAADIYWNHVYNRNLSDFKVEEINQALRQISDFIGDEPWRLAVSKKDKFYVAGYKNAPVLNENYYSPYAGGMFRQTKSQTQEDRNKQLEKRLFDWAKTHGISVQALEVLLEKYEGRYEQGILGVADFANAIIGIADNAKLDTLPEEVAHFAIELMINDPSIQRAIETVDTTDVYNIVKEDYKDIYNNELDFRKEAVAKILAQEIISEFRSRENIPANQRGFWTFLQAAADKFVNWVRRVFNQNSPVRQDFNDYVRPLAISILENNYLGDFGNSIDDKAANILYQLDSEEESPEKEEVEDPSIQKKKQFLEEVILQLSDRMSLLKRGAKSQVRISAIEGEIKKLEYQLAKGQLDLGILGFIKLAESEIKVIDESLKKARLTNNINPTTLVMSENFMQMYDGIFRSFIESMYDENIPAEETEELRKLIHNLSVSINDARGINRVLMKKVTRDILEKANTDAYGNKIDPDFDPDIVSQDTFEDMNYWRLNVGNYKYADSKIIRAAHKIVFNAISNVGRFKVEKANELVKLQEQMLKTGGKIEDLIEIGANGKYTHYFIQEYKWSEYYDQMNKTKQDIAEALGYENYNQIQSVFLTPAELKIQKAHWAKFFNNHTQKVKIKDSRGVSIETTVPNDSYKDPRFARVMSNPATQAYYEALIRSKKEAVDKLPVQYRSNRLIYMVPPILKSTLDRLTNNEQSFLSRVAQLGREALFIDQDETQFGQLNVLNNKMVPIYFTRPLDNLQDLSFDVARSVTLFSEMAENFTEMNKISGPLGSLQYSLAERNYFTDQKGTQRKKGIESKEYQALETLLDTHVFGIERNALATKPLPENKITKALGIDGKEFSWTKLSQNLAGFIRTNNLALNITTSLSGWLKGSGDSIIEDQIGVYTTNESKNWARTEFAANLFQVLGQVGKTVQTNKMHLILQQSEIANIDKVLKDTTRNRATRTLFNKDLLYVTYATGDYGLKGRVTLAIYDNYRLYNGEFMTRAKFFEKTAAEKNVENTREHQKEVSKQWKELREKSLYNAYDVVDGKLELKPEFEKYVNSSLLNSVKGKVDHVTTYIDGTLSKTDKGKLARTVAGDFLLMHRGWFIGLIDTRFKKETTNLLTEEEEIGTYRATLGFLYTAFFKAMIKDKAGLQGAMATWKNLSAARKRGVLKTGLDLLYLNLVALVASMANLAADEGDDDDWTLQYTAYQLNRLLLEQGAAWSPAELIQMIDEPVVGARMIRDLLDVSEAFNFDEVYESGMYEDKSHGQKWWMKKLPTRNLYELQFPELKNRFIKTLTDSDYYNWMSDEQKHSVGKKASFYESLFPTNIFDDPDTREEVAQVIVEDLEEDTEEENGFN